MVHKMSIIAITKENEKEYQTARKRTALPIGKMIVDFIEKNADEIDEKMTDKGVGIALEPICGITFFNNPLIPKVQAEINEGCEDYVITFHRKSVENSRGKFYSQPVGIIIKAKA